MWLWIFRIAVLFLVLTVSYVILSAYRRWDRRNALEAEFQSAPSMGMSREVFVSAGLKTYDRSLRKRLLLGVFLIPLLTAAILIALAQIG